MFCPVVKHGKSYNSLHKVRNTIFSNMTFKGIRCEARAFFYWLYMYYFVILFNYNPEVWNIVLIFFCTFVRSYTPIIYKRYY